MSDFKPADRVYVTDPGHPGMHNDGHGVSFGPVDDSDAVPVGEGTDG